MSGQFIIPLLIAGMTSYFPTRTEPTINEFETCPNRFELTYDESLDWDPGTDQFMEQEMQMQLNDLI
jgi:hypothetical protein